MQQNIIFYFSRLSSKLWFKPLIFCILSIVGALVAHFADGTFLTDIVPDIRMTLWMICLALYPIAC